MVEDAKMGQLCDLCKHAKCAKCEWEDICESLIQEGHLFESTLDKNLDGAAKHAMVRYKLYGAFTKEAYGVLGKGKENRRRLPKCAEMRIKKEFPLVKKNKTYTYFKK